jgi:hypothetical protein
MRLPAIAAIACCLWCVRIARAESAIFWVSGPVRPGETVLATGHFPEPQQLSIKVANIEPSAGDWRAITSANGVGVTPLKITETSIMFVLPDMGGDGVYGIRVDQPHEASVYARVNLPEVWWTMAESPSANPEVESRIDLDSASAGARLRLFGRCLTYAGAAGSASLTSQAGKTVDLPTTNEGSYELTLTLPRDIAPGQYSLEVRPATGGNAVASAPHPLQIRVEAEAHLMNLSVADFGANGDSHFDNTPAFKAALMKAEALGGAVLRIPAGGYFLSQPIEIPPHVYLVGESSNRTALYFPDVDPAPPAWVSGQHHFGLENLAIFCGNHNAIISSDMSGDPDVSGHSRMRNLFIRGSSFRGHPSPELVARRLTQVMKTSGGSYESIRLSGPDLIVEDCDVLGTSMPLYLYRAHGSIVRRNILHVGMVGWYSFRAVNGVLVENNLIRGEGLLASGGAYAHAWSERSRNIYTANNTYSEIMGFDAEAFTSDGGGGVYFGPAQQSRGRTLVLEGTPDWGSTANWKDHWKGALVAIIAGHGAGQWRTLESWSGQEVELSEGFGIAPDTTSRITIVPLQLHYIFYRNHFSNAGVAIQFYGVAVEHIVAENDESNAGGFYFSAHRYVGGVAPQLNVQLLENHVREGWNYHFGPNHMPAPGPSLIKVVSHAPSAVIGMVIRNNELAAGSTIEVHSESPSGVIGMLVDKNRVSNGKHDLQIDPSVAGEVLITQ